MNSALQSQILVHIMRKELAYFAIMTILVLSIASLSGKTWPPIVSATYVEGVITQDTVWTLVNSPFVLSNDVVVNSNATLTVEPGVEVRFGGDFSLTVHGKMVANGTEQKMISFTSNKLDPAPDDWGTIFVDERNQSSMLYCIVEYSKDGITIGDGSLILQNSLIFNNGKGLILNFGDVVAIHNVISNNTESGIEIGEADAVTIQNNTIQSNAEGIVLNGHLTSTIRIVQNEIELNAQAGIDFATNSSGNAFILQNNLSSNKYGFYISRNAPTYITRNYVFGNDMGIFYSAGTSHEAHFNDIFNNRLGMDISDTAAVDATYNYWGDRSGPYHTSENPYGRGNEVGNTGTDLDFIFYLTAPIDYSNGQPTSNLWTDKVLVAPNQNVTFVGADSYDDRKVDQYFYDFNDDSVTGWTTLSLFNHSYSSVGTYIASLLVKDDFNVTSDMAFATIDVMNLPPLEAIVSLNSTTVYADSDVSVTVFASDGVVPMENATVALFSIKDGIFAPITGLTDAAGYLTATFTAPTVTELSNLRIIARVSKTGYTDGSNYAYVKVLPHLLVQVNAEPSTIKSEGASNVTVYVSSGIDSPVPNAVIEISSDIGDLSSTMDVTGSDGRASFLFTAPETMVELNANITMTVTKTEYVDGEGRIAVHIVPKVLDLQLLTQDSVTISNGLVNLTARVTYEGMPISDAAITVASDSGGSFSATTGLTDLNGALFLTFTAPPTNISSIITLSANASRTTYVDGQASLGVTVNPGVLDIEVSASSSTVSSRDSAIVTLLVTCNSEAVEQALVTLSADYGNFSAKTGYSIVNGSCTFIFSAPETKSQLNAVITVQAEKNGYVSAANQTTITVIPQTIVPEEGGLPWITILLIIIPIVIAVIVAVLIKLKIITFSPSEEEQ